MAKKTRSTRIKPVHDPFPRIIWDPSPIWLWDPPPDWIKALDKEQLNRFRNLEIKLQKKQLEINKHFIADVKKILKQLK